MALKPKNKKPSGSTAPSAGLTAPTEFIRPAAEAEADAFAASLGSLEPTPADEDFDSDDDEATEEELPDSDDDAEPAAPTPEPAPPAPKAEVAVLMPTARTVTQPAVQKTKVVSMVREDFRIGNTVYRWNKGEVHEVDGSTLKVLLKTKRVTVIG